MSCVCDQSCFTGYQVNFIVVVAGFVPYDRFAMMITYGGAVKLDAG